MGSKGIFWVKNYRGRMSNLPKSDKDAQGFYNILDGVSQFESPEEEACDRDLEHQNLGNPPDGNDLNKADNVDIVYFSGHGKSDGPLFGIDDKDNGIAHYTEMRLGRKCEWIIFSACYVLNKETYRKWQKIFGGLHGMLGFDTHCHSAPRRGEQFAKRLNEGETLLRAWAKACEETDWWGVRWAALFAKYHNGSCENDHWWGKGRVVQSFGRPISFSYQSGVI
jgi:hypothetical protein